MLMFSLSGLTRVTAHRARYVGLTYSDVFICLDGIAFLMYKSGSFVYLHNISQFNLC